MTDSAGFNRSSAHSRSRIRASDASSCNLYTEIQSNPFASFYYRDTF